MDLFLDGDAGQGWFAFVESVVVVRTLWIHMWNTYCTYGGDSSVV